MPRGLRPIPPPKLRSLASVFREKSTVYRGTPAPTKCTGIVRRAPSPPLAAPSRAAKKDSWELADGFGSNLSWELSQSWQRRLTLGVGQDTRVFSGAAFLAHPSIASNPKLSMLCLA